MDGEEQRRTIQFGPYCVTGHAGQVLRGSQPLRLSPKAVAVLWALVRRAGQVVSKEALFAEVWPETAVTEGVLTNCIHELRRELREQAARPRYLETVHRRGYRFIAAVQATGPDDPSRGSVARADGSAPAPRQRRAEDEPSAAALVGRDGELERLHGLYAKAVAGERQIVFVTGEAGIGKTALVEAFLRGLRSGVPDHGMWLGQGQCVEHYGAGEAYLPVLEALGRLCRQADGDRVVGVLRRVAPTWLAQLPALLSEAEYAALQQQVVGVARARMLREMADAVEVLAAERPLVIELEDLHWSDVSTVDLLTMLARGRGVARLLVLATYRPAELIVSEHPLRTIKQELVGRRQATEVALGGLGGEAVQQYVQERLPGRAAGDALAAFVYRRTDGHPLFMVEMTDCLAQAPLENVDGAAGIGSVEQSIPQTLRELIEAQIGRLPEDAQQVLEVASVAGAEFAVASVATGIVLPSDAVEAICERLARQGQFIDGRGVATWPDGTVSGRYGFRHALYRDVLYQRVGASRRARLHLAIGLREEAGHRDRANALAPELAMHFELGHDTPRAAYYLSRAGENALRTFAYPEAIRGLERGLTLLATQPESPARDQQELRIQLALGWALAEGENYGKAGVDRVYARARSLCSAVEATPQLFMALSGLTTFYAAHGQVDTALALARQGLEVAERLSHPAFVSSAQGMLGSVVATLGDWTGARDYLRQALAFYDARPRRVRAAAPTTDQEVVVRSYLGVTQWMLGYPDQGLESAERAVGIAEDLHHPPSIGFALSFLGMVRGFRGEHAAEATIADRMVALAQNHGLRVWAAHAAYLRGEALVLGGQFAKGGEAIRAGLGAATELGTEAGHPWRWARLAEAEVSLGRVEEAERALSAGFAHGAAGGERYYDPELHRLQGELHVGMASAQREGPRAGRKRRRGATSTGDHWGEAEACFMTAIDLATRQRSKSLELRAATSLARLWRQQGKHDEARVLLAEIFGWFSEAFDTSDMQAARALLAE